MKRRGAKEEDGKMSPDAARLMMAMGFLQMFNPKGGVDDVMEKALSVYMEMTGLERGFAFINAGENGEEDLRECARVQPKPGDASYNLSRSFIKLAIEKKKIIIEDALDQAVEKSQTVVDFKICSAVVVPVFIDDELKAVFYMDKQLASKKLPMHLSYSTRLLRDLIARALSREIAGVGKANLDQYSDFLRQILNEMEIVVENLGVITDAFTDYELSDIKEGIDSQVAKLDEVLEALAQV
ncbi:hypothetical protein PQO03_12410 [Lentisphaera profundi]|uniref:GAF domain-containing protein n=1 Tax=Lentisphaera profundi TaxID=1658616 RepID=A0ABY7VZD8_9BACT|nr:hypothetical protein [Lentisphaera profundi]WDE98639.1 hypothetical protein PQO03_12410 [Lentisphaera profundi]